MIADWTRTRTAGEVVALLRERQIPVSRINSIADIAVDPQVLAREMIVAVDDDRLDRPLLVPGIAPKLSRTPGRVPPLARPLGADTEAVRARFGGTGDGASRAAGRRRRRASRSRPAASLAAESRMGVVPTFRGPVDGADLGPTLIHEHVFVRNLELEGVVPGLIVRAGGGHGAGDPRADRVARGGDPARWST